MPESYVPYIERFGVYTNTPKLELCLCSFQDKLSFAFTSRYDTVNIERNFYRLLKEQGITSALYLVLKSNGLRHSKNPPVRFSFSLKIVPATIAKKLPLQLRPKPLFIAFFSLSHKRPTFAFTSESGYTLAFRRRIAHNGSHGETGAFPPSATARSCAVSEIPFSPPRFYIHSFPGSL